MAANFRVEIVVIGAHGLSLASGRRFHDAADRFHHQRPAIAFA
jgi:hypothetical protein